MFRRDGQVHTQPVTRGSRRTAAAWVFVGTGGGVSGLMLDLSGEKPHLGDEVGDRRRRVVADSSRMACCTSRTRITLRALDPASGKVLWSSTEIGAIHWQTPIIARNHLYICDADQDT